MSSCPEILSELSLLLGLPVAVGIGDACSGILLNTGILNVIARLAFISSVYAFDPLLASLLAAYIAVIY